MATRADPYYRPITVEEFFSLTLSSDRKFELDRGVIVAMAGGTRRHAQVQGNLFVALHSRLRGSPCRPFGSDMAIKTSDSSVRYPDASVVCGVTAADDAETSFDNPMLIAEILSPTTRDNDLGTKLKEYEALASLEMILFIDPADETIRLHQRLGPDSWRIDKRLEGDIPLPSLNITLPRAEIFARD
ncbi:Uma2 family endonuclease [Sandaracinobacteroides saxicola]|uniref:Uma2 family endonuclease n=1 Tax=Sandaracinobacteroides saxicola TaxID=2759707 RepID=A0A7G5IDS0_9SPHN|nr:Uma2 family endonuclease [Sandaracinobacteroides saxicola]QMW21512.1 Uma2 family endonuclease [Sandaracinobacteroides saxicola]